MRHSRGAPPLRKGSNPTLIPPQPPSKRSKQPYDAFLVLDVEATCQEGADFNFPNEIIEFPVCLMRWRDGSGDRKVNHLEIVEEFRSFVRPSWQPILSQFCTNLTGIKQEQVNAAPLFPEVLDMFQNFLIEHGLLHKETGERLVRFCWCSDGPYDVRDFIVKQCFISKIQMPRWIQGDVLDVRATVLDLLDFKELRKYRPAATGRTLNIPAQLKVLGLPAFVGRQHSGIDDSRNVARIVAELARRGISLYPNTTISPKRRWGWMGKYGQILGYQKTTQ